VNGKQRLHSSVRIINQLEVAGATHYLMNSEPMFGHDFLQPGVVVGGDGCFCCSIVKVFERSRSTGGGSISFITLFLALRSVPPNWKQRCAPQWPLMPIHGSWFKRR
jgi:hypothetical protein